jgi:hypothetical protein
MLHRILLASLLCAVGSQALAQAPKPLPPIAEKTGGLEARQGYFRLYLDAAQNIVWLQIDRFDEEFLYVEWLSRGLGYNPLGLDRAQLGETRVVRFRRVGRRVLLEEPNQRYRASGGPDEVRAVEESFASSVLWGADITAESGGSALVDLTPFLVRDSHAVADRLQGSNEGSFKLDPKRSAVLLDEVRAFPRNCEMEALLTFEGSKPGRGVRETTPSPDALTLHVRHSFVALPPPGYTPRRFDPRAGVGPVEFADYSAALDAPLETRWIRRHRLNKQDPAAAMSPPAEPITYYLDRGAPEPVRSALLAGARWWNQAFEAAGYQEGFRVELLPAGADPLDLRYSVINWVHRSTRGWSYGGSVVDPRTGEILKGVVTLGSLRVRQDRLLFEGLIPFFGPTKPAGPSPVDVALARLRQLSAHEVGHTLGFAHNFAASSFGRGSVMDYPAPLVRITEDSKLDLSEAYGVGIAEWDKTAVRYAYSDFPPGADEDAELDRILADAHARGLLFISDADSRPLGAPHPLSSLWDNGADPVSALRQTMEVRRIALENFGLDNVPKGTPLSELELWLTPLYLHHRYQVEATAKMLGGLSFDYGVRGKTGELVEMVPAARQRAALQALLETLNPAALALPERMLELIPPPAYGYNDRRETFDSRSGRRFDPLAAARVALDVTLAAMLEPNRAARLVEQQRRDSSLPGLEEVFRAIRKHAQIGGGAALADGSRGLIQLEEQASFTERVMELAKDRDLPPAVRGIAEHELLFLSENLPYGSEARRALERPAEASRPPAPLPAPPGSPIGAPK